MRSSERKHPDMLAIPVRQISILFVAVLSGILFAFPRSTLAAQALGSLAGTVSSGVNDAPLKSATVTVLGRDIEAVTDEEGRFFFADLPIGEITLSTELRGYASVVERVNLTSDEVGLLQIRLTPVMAALAELLVVVGGESATHGSSDAEVGGDDDSRSAADLLATSIPGVYVTLSQGSAGTGARIRIRGSSSLSLSNAPVIYLNGIRITPRQGASPARASTGLHVLELIPASEVERIRVLGGPSAAVEYPDATHGVILVETRRDGL